MSTLDSPAVPVLCLSADIDFLHGERCFAGSSPQISPEKVTHAIASAVFYVNAARRSANLALKSQAYATQRRGDPEETMQGLMMDMPLLISGLIQYAADYHGEAEIVAREIEGDIHRYTYAD